MRALPGILLASVVAVTVAGCSSSSTESQPSPNAPTVASASPSPTVTTCAFDETVTGVHAESAEGGLPAVSVEQGAKPPTELVTETLCPGSGAEAKLGDVVVVNYTMAPYSIGQQLESSFEAGQPLDFAVVHDGRLIQGFTRGVEGMKVGEVRLVLVPGDLAYGSPPPPGSPFEPNEAFAFLMRLDQVIPA